MRGTRVEVSIRNNHSKVTDILDTWKQRGVNVSDKICKIIEQAFEEEERGDKITNFFNISDKQQSTLPLLPRIYEIATVDQLGKLTDEELRQVAMATGETYYKCQLLIQKRSVSLGNNKVV